MVGFDQDQVVVQKSCPLVTKAYRNWQAAREIFRRSFLQDSELASNNLDEAKKELIEILERPTSLYSNPLNGEIKLYDYLLLSALEKNNCSITGYELNDSLLYWLRIQIADDSRVSTMPSIVELIVCGDAALDSKVTLRTDSLGSCQATALTLQDLVVDDDIVYPQRLRELTVANCALGRFDLSKLPNSVETIYINLCTIGEIILTDLPKSLTGVYLLLGRFGRSPTTLSNEVRELIFSLRDKGITVMEM